MKLFIIINPASANGKTLQRWRALQAQLQAAGFVFDCALTQSPQHATVLAQQAAAHGYNTVACVGGDGTVNEVVNGLMLSRHKPTLAVLPSGTGSDFARTISSRARVLALGKSTDHALQLLRHGTTQTIDVGEVQCQHNNKDQRRYFINIAGMGFDGDVCLALHGRPKRGGTAAYFLTVLRVLGRYKNKSATIQLSTPNGEHQLQGRYNSIVVANGQFFGGGMQVAPHAALNDGWFDVVLIGDVTRAEFIATFPKIYRGTHLGHPKVKLQRAREIRIEIHPAEPAAVQAEGELIGYAPATVRLLPKALQVLCRA